MPQSVGKLHASTPRPHYMVRGCAAVATHSAVHMDSAAFEVCNVEVLWKWSVQPHTEREASLREARGGTCGSQRAGQPATWAARC